MAPQPSTCWSAAGTGRARPRPWSARSAATGFLTTSLPVTAAVAGVLAVLLVVSGRAGSTVLVTGLVVTAMALVAEWPVAAAAVGCAGAVLVAFQATLHRQDVARNLALLSLVPAAGALAALEGVVSEPTAIVGGLLLAAVLAWELDQARCGDALGWVPRVAGTVLLLPMADHGAADIAMVTAVYVGLATLEGFRRDDRTPLFGWAIGLPPLVGSVAVLAGLEPVESAVVLAAAAFPVAAAGHLRAELRLPLMATASSLAVCGIAVGAAEPGVLGTVLLLDGLVALGLGLATREVALLAGGGTAAVIGTWIHLNLGGIEAIDLYALPVAVLLWLVASRVADDTVSSWVTHAPAIALAGGAALAERIGGGGGAHALLAGAIGVLAVVEGGGRRLAAPLLLGTGLLDRPHRQRDHGRHRRRAHVGLAGRRWHAPGRCRPGHGAPRAGPGRDRPPAGRRGPGPLPVTPGGTTTPRSVTSPALDSAKRWSQNEGVAGYSRRSSSATSRCWPAGSARWRPAGRRGRPRAGRSGRRGSAPPGRRPTYRLARQGAPGEVPGQQTDRDAQRPRRAAR